MFQQKSWNLLNLMKNISLSSQNRQIFAACYLRHDLYVERKNKYIKKHSKDLKSQKERLQKIVKYVGTRAHKIHRHDIQDLSFICENEEDVSILRQIILGTQILFLSAKNKSKIATILFDFDIFTLIISITTPECRNKSLHTLFNNSSYG